jgi:hypothetical protein
MLVPKINVLVKKPVVVLNQYSSVHHPINISNTARGKLSGKVGVCMLPDKSLHFAVEVLIEHMNPPEIMLPLNALVVAD